MPHPGHPPTVALDRERIDRGLRAMIPDPHDRSFVVRCLLDEGPAHHRVANFALVALLLELLSGLGTSAVRSADGVEVPMRLPPHLSSPDASYPVALDAGVLWRITREPDAIREALSEGPPQHAVANVVMVNLLGAALAALDSR